MGTTKETQDGNSTIIGMDAFMIEAYTGNLLTYTRHSLWDNPVLPLLFLVSALGTGYALFLVIAISKKEMEQSRLW